MALDIGKNSFVTLLEAQSIVENELYSGSEEYILWGKLTDKDKEIVCKRGTLSVNKLTFIGQRVNNRGLKFPRYIHGSDEIPYGIKVATVIQGLKIMTMNNNESHNLIMAGVKSMTVGPNSISLDNNNYLKNMETGLCADAMVHIDKYILTSVRM